MQNRATYKKLSVTICLSDQQECKYGVINAVEYDGGMLKEINIIYFNLTF